MTRRINDIADLAVEERNHAVGIFLQWFISEQVEEEDSVSDAVGKLKMVGDGGGLFMLDRDLGTRVFTLPGGRITSSNNGPGGAPLPGLSSQEQDTMNERGHSILLWAGGPRGPGAGDHRPSHVAGHRSATGYHLLVDQRYMSRVRGGHTTPLPCAWASRNRTAPPRASTSWWRVNKETVDTHRNALVDGGIVLAGDDIDTDGLNALRIPFTELAPKPLFHNTVALGVLGATICNDVAILETLLAETFAKKGEAVVQANVDVVRAAFDWVKKQDFRLLLASCRRRRVPRRG